METKSNKPRSLSSNEERYYTLGFLQLATESALKELELNVLSNQLDNAEKSRETLGVLLTAIFNTMFPEGEASVQHYIDNGDYLLPKGATAKEAYRYFELMTNAIARPQEKTDAMRIELANLHALLNDNKKPKADE